MGEVKVKNRKTMRLYGADYDREGIFFLTICTKSRKCILSRIVGTGVLDGPKSPTDIPEKQILVGTGVPDGPHIELLPHGKTAEKFIRQLNDFYEYITVQSYVIMPNHIHLLLAVSSREEGPSRTPVPTVQNSTVSRFVSTFKRFSNKEYGGNIWQYRSHDHIIRDREDHERHVGYILENPMHWSTDELYAEG